MFSLIAVSRVGLVVDVIVRNEVSNVPHVMAPLNALLNSISAVYSVCPDFRVEQLSVYSYEIIIVNRNVSLRSP